MAKQQGDTPISEWVTTKEAGAILGITSRHVNLLVSQGVLEAIKVTPRMTLVKRDSLSSYTPKKRGRKPRGRPIE